MVETRAALFPTAIGACGIAWRGEIVVATHLPETDEAATFARLAARAGNAVAGDPPRSITSVVAAITALLEGRGGDLAFIECDFSALDPFNAKVYAEARTIPPGETLTYGAIAERLGDKRYAQAVGQALGRNPFPIVVPCHRVMGANGRLTGFSANGGTATKLKMLAIEGARLGEAPGLFDDLPLAAKPAPGR
jgi:methylated-DNA-[protein]-cysteine S-methyltransferase